VDGNGEESAEKEEPPYDDDNEDGSPATVAVEKDLFVEDNACMSLFIDAFRKLILSLFCSAGELVVEGGKMSITGNTTAMRRSISSEGPEPPLPEEAALPTTPLLSEESMSFNILLI
jgi:hypothetical protein